MDNLTHSLVGLTAAKAGLERVSPYATTVCVFAANAPDVDIVALAGGRWFYLQHHRGITHSIVGVLALALLIPLVFCAVERVIARRRARRPTIRPGGLVLASLAASVTHPLLDWMNNYGVRPFLPWSGKWYYGDLVFIIDPWLWLLLGGAAFLATARTWPRVALWTALALVLTVAFIFFAPDTSHPHATRALWLVWLGALVAAHAFHLGARWGRAIPALALALVLAYCGALAIVHARALTRARALAEVFARNAGETPLRVAAMPAFADPARWRVVAETDRTDYLFDLSLNGDSATGGLRARQFEKLQGAEAERIGRLALEDYRGRVFLGFARFPLARLTRTPDGVRRIEWVDLRFTEPGAASRRGNFAVEIPLPDDR